MEKKEEKEKSGEGPAVKEESLGEKLKRVEFLVGKRGGHNTPVLTPWRLLQFPPAHDSNLLTSSFPTPSARKLAATLYQLHQYNLPFSKMHQGVPAPLPRLRHHHRHRHLLTDKPDDHRDPSPSAPDMPESASSLRRHVAASLMQHHRSIQRNNNYALQPVSPASYDSSMEMAPYNPAVTPTSSIDFKGGLTGETSTYSLKTSTELLKVLNRIWVLEEQHASNASLVRALKKELDHARSKIKDLVRTQHSDRHEVDELMKKLAEDKALRKSKEQERINSAVQSVREELENERNLRKRSETLHRKLARELYEVKISLSNVVKERERERKSRKILEDLCDEFALEIREYEQELHALKKNRGDRDRSILHISESWIDERMQMKLEPPSEKNPSIVEKLSSEIEVFLHAKQAGNNKNHTENNSNKLVEKNPNRRSSLESIPLNLAISAPQHEGDGDDDEESLDSDSHCFELDKPQRDEMEESQILKSKKKSVAENRSVGRHPTNLQVKFEEQMAQAAISSNNDDMEEGQNGESDKKYEICEEANERSKSSNYMENLIRSHYMLSESGNNTKVENDYTWRSHASPIRQWTSTLPSSSSLQDLETLESSKLPQDSNNGTLKSKLLEARIRGQRSRSRLKSSKRPFH